MDTNPVTNVDYFFKNTTYFISLNFSLPDAPDISIPCVFYTDVQAFNDAMDMVEQSKVDGKDPFSIHTVGQGHQLLFCLIYLDPDKKGSFLRLCMTLWLMIELHDIRFRGINRMAEITTVSEFYHRLILQFGIVL